MLPWALLTGISLAIVLAASAAGRKPITWVTKPLASLGFVGAALAADVGETPHGQVMLAAFALCCLGDVLLLGRSKLPFLSGLAAFLLGHVVFSAAFVVRGLSPAASGLALLPLLAVVAVVRRWLKPHVKESMRAPVAAYILVITAMVALAAGAAAAGAPPALLAGALCLYLSDLAVARERFVSSTWTNRLWGLPLYYGGQFLLIASA